MLELSISYHITISFVFLNLGKSDKKSDNSEIKIHVLSK